MLARVTDERWPDPLEVFEVVGDRAALVAADEGADGIDLEPLRRLDHATQVVVGGLPGVRVGVEIVRVVGERRDLQVVAAEQLAHSLRIEIVDVDVRYAGVAAMLAPAGRPASDLECVEAVGVRPHRDLLEREIRKRRRQKAQLHPAGALTARSTSTHLCSRWLRATASHTSISSWPSANVG